MGYIVFRDKVLVKLLHGFLGVLFITVSILFNEIFQLASNYLTVK